MFDSAHDPGCGGQGLGLCWHRNPERSGQMTRRKAGQARRQELSLASRSAVESTERENACCRSGSPAGSDIERERAETRDSRPGDAKRTRGLGAGQGFVDFDSCNVARGRWFAPRAP